MPTPPLKDPWARLETWRRSPEITSRANVRQLFPGLAIGTGIFVVACVIEALGGSKDKHH